MAFQNTLSLQRGKIDGLIANQLVKTRLAAPILVQEVLKKVSTFIINKVMRLFAIYLPPGLTKPPVPEGCECESVNTSGFLCIHLIQEYWEAKRSFSIQHFHRHWRLAEVSPSEFNPDTARVREPYVIIRGGKD